MVKGECFDPQKHETPLKIKGVSWREQNGYPHMEQATGIEPAQSAWEAEVLPLNHACERWYYTASSDKCQVCFLIFPIFCLAIGIHSMLYCYRIRLCKGETHELRRRAVYQQLPRYY